MFLVMLPGFLVFGLGVAAMAAIPPAGLALICLAVLYFLICGVISSSLNTIFLAALYQYASTKTVPAGFDRLVIEGAFQPKPRSAA
jgi:hypothetical protein